MGNAPPTAIRTRSRGAGPASRSAAAIRVCATVILALAALGAAAGAQRVVVGAFKPGSLAKWETESFEGRTLYRLVGEGPRRALKASCDGTASGIVLRKPIDLTETPILHWEWRVDHIFQGLDGTTKAGDDYAARIYVIHDGGWFLWQTVAINYVWANTRPVGSHWPNPFTDNAMMVAVQSGPPQNPGSWVEESRNVRADFRRFFGIDLAAIDGIAIMTDCDNSERATTAYYRDIYFASE